jgi:hypothetical protein
VQHTRKILSKRGQTQALTCLRKGLFVDEGNSDHDTDAQVQRVTDDEVHNLMNIETIIPNEKESQVSVLISYPNSRVVVKESFDKLSDLFPYKKYCS